MLDGRGRSLVRAVVWMLVGGLGISGAVLVRPAEGHATEPLPGVMAGWDTYRQLDRLPYLGIGAQTLQSSSYDRSGNNDDGAGGCVGTGGAGCVVAADQGAGEIDSIWFTINEGDVSVLGDLRIEVDGRTVVNAPLQSVVDGKLGAPFAFPLVANADQSPGGVYIKVPMPYRESMRVSVQNQVQYYHVTYRHFVTGIGLATFDPADPATDVLAMLRSAGSHDPKPPAPNARRDRRTVAVPAGSRTTIAQSFGSGMVSALRLRLPTRDAFTALRLRIAFDGRESVDSPVGEFFGLGRGPDDVAPVRSLLFAADPQPGGWVSAWWPMPFAGSVSVSLENTGGDPIDGLETEVVTDSDPQWASALAFGAAGHFTTRSNAGPTVPGRDWLFADEVGHGKFVGVSHTMNGHRPDYLEGNERVYVDGSPSPQIPGTGTEDFYEGGWYFGGSFGAARNFSLPLTGASTERTTASGCEGYCVTAYRLMLAESVDYLTRLRFGIEHGPVHDNEQADYSSTAFLYN
ncbi:glycoside hydrolase family 172 protein [Nocardia sp. NPDC051570]|uniref:glycoside hydrolase family 172 protein n=1 Tax=Nocardia sp. NPDC051570 TaxID=3364324 RepID=UPI0037A7002F